MSETDHKILELEARLESLVRTQIDFQVEVIAIRDELTRLRSRARPEPAEPAPPPAYQPPQPEPARPKAEYQPRAEPAPERTPAFGYQSQQTNADSGPTPASDFFSSYFDNARNDLEKFIGENLISKMGIVVLILGVGIGAKYAIDNELISPTARIALGYLFGFGLLGFAVWLKPKYHAFSAVLLSGGLAILYFITYFAYAVYGLIGQTSAWPLMVILTVFTVAASVFYNLQTIAHVGLVGAYAVPFLLSSGSGNYLALFGYMAIINAGVLALSIKRYWRAIFYTASAFTWIIFLAWFVGRYRPEENLYLGLGFLAIFFATFYAAKVIHGVLRSESKEAENVAAIIVTALIFFGFCFAISDFEGSNLQYAFLFCYLGVIALAILLTSYRWYGRALIFITYPLTWLIFAHWFVKYYSADRHLVLAATVAALYFGVFYGATLIYRLVKEDLVLAESAGMLLTNSFIFYGFGYAILDSREPLQAFQGVFTVGHAALHPAVAQAVNRFKPAADDVIQILAILIVTFATIAVPVQFDGNFVTMIWAVEAAGLFFFGRTRQIKFFEYFSYPVMLLAAVSMLMDWSAVYSDRFDSTVSAALPFANGDFITGGVFVAAIGVIWFLNSDKSRDSALGPEIGKISGRIFAVITFVALYNVVRMEIGGFYHLQSAGGARSADLSRLNVVTQIDYTMLFLALMAVVNLRRVRSAIAAYANIALSILTLAVFLTVGMFLLYELRVTYLAGEATGLFGIESAGVLVRYFSYAVCAGLVASLYAYSRSKLLEDAASVEARTAAFDAVMHSTILIIASCEVMNISAHLDIADAERFGLSILWGIYSLALIVLGIARSRKHLRIAAIVLLAVTLIKLFFYDITDLGTIPKTLLFVSLGLLMLVISFLYNKYKNVIFATVKEGEN